MHKERYRVGALLRRSFRAALDTADIEFSEYKGWLDSEFIVEATEGQHQAIHTEIERMNGND